MRERMRVTHVCMVHICVAHMPMTSIAPATTRPRTACEGRVVWRLVECASGMERSGGLVVAAGEDEEAPERVRRRRAQVSRFSNCLAWLQ